MSETGYYPFGMLQSDRQYSIGNGYRYGFNGKENDNEVKGEGNQQDYGMRIYDPRLGRFLSVDPISSSYPELTPYQFASNTPIDAIDLDGLEMISSKEAYIQVGFQYDSELKQLTSGYVWMTANSPNMPNWISGNIIDHNANLKSHHSKYYKGINSIVVAEFRPEAALIEDEVSSMAEKMVDESTSLSGRSGTYVANSGRTRAEQQMEAENPGKPNPMGVNFSRLNRANAALEIITRTANFIGELIKSDQISKLDFQITQAAGVFNLLEKAVSGNLPGITIPAQHLNSISLEKIGNYALSGTPIYDYKTNAAGEEIKTVNKELTGIAKNILAVYIYTQNQIIKGKELNKVQQYQKSAIDQTNKSNF